MSIMARKGVSVPGDEKTLVATRGLQFAVVPDIQHHFLFMSRCSNFMVFVHTDWFCLGDHRYATASTSIKIFLPNAYKKLICE